MLQVTAAYDQALIGELPLQEVEGALYKAHSLKDAPLPKHERIAILKRLAALIERDKESLVHTAAQEGGKPWSDSLVEVERGIAGIECAIATLSNEGGHMIPMGHTPASAGRLAFTLHEPCGVVVAFSAFNHPFNLIIHQVIPAVAVGCPVIVKPAPGTPFSCARIVDLLREAGLPEGWCQMVICDIPQAQKLISDPRIAFFTFIGSAKVGWELRKLLPPGARCALEHGGSAPVVVLDDADTTSLIPLLAKGGFYHAGQVCVSVQRVFSPNAASIGDHLADVVGKLKVGDPLKKETEVGPLIRPGEVARVHEWVEEAVKGGGKLLCGGKVLSETCYAPTVILDPPDTVRLSREEIFGPVVALYTSETASAIRRANQLPFSFQAAVFGERLDTLLEVVQELNATAVMINDHTAFRVDWMPFAGRQTSGLSTGGIPYTMADMTDEKMVVIRSPALEQ